MEQLLIVEDDIGLNQGLCKALKADDRQIISCQDLKAAREQLLCGSVSLILLDINLPDGSGLELLREVKENTPYIPVILLTANDTDLDIVDGLKAHQNTVALLYQLVIHHSFHKPLVDAAHQWCADALGITPCGRPSGTLRQG